VGDLRDMGDLDIGETKMYVGDEDVYGRLRYIWETEIYMGD
jgi:hypothetical protein